MEDFLPRIYAGLTCVAIQLLSDYGRFPPPIFVEPESAKVNTVRTGSTFSVRFGSFGSEPNQSVTSFLIAVD